MHHTATATPLSGLRLSSAVEHACNCAAHALELADERAAEYRRLLNREIERVKFIELLEAADMDELENRGAGKIFMLQLANTNEAEIATFWRGHAETLARARLAKKGVFA